MTPPVLLLRDVAKDFILHLQGGLRLPVVQGVNFALGAGECAVLGGPSGAGKSSILKMIYGNYRCETGSIGVRYGHEMVDVTTASVRRLQQLRRDAMAYVSQFLRVIPRVGALDIVAAAAGPVPDARDRAGALLSRLNLPERLWNLPPATFSGGEQQRVNIARGFIADRPLLLLDEPTASLDAANRAVVIELIAEKKRTGTAVLGIFHDAQVRDAVADQVIDVTRFMPHTSSSLAAESTP